MFFMSNRDTSMYWLKESWKDCSKLDQMKMISCELTMLLSMPPSSLGLSRRRKIISSPCHFSLPIIQRHLQDCIYFWLTIRVVKTDQLFQNSPSKPSNGQPSEGLLHTFFILKAITTSCLECKFSDCPMLYPKVSN